MRKSTDEENMLFSLVPGGIEAQEKVGQSKFVQSQTLPIKGYIKPDLEKLGFKFGKQCDNPLFVNVEFPEGWEKLSTDHSMWSKLIDDKGRKRGSIFYKAAFYDEDAFLNLNERYYAEYRPVEGWSTDGNVSSKKVRTWLGAVVDSGTENTIFTTDPVEIDEDKGESWKITDALQDTAKEWLEENYPDHKNVLAYWD